MKKGLIFAFILFLNLTAAAFAEKNCSSPVAAAIKDYAITRYKAGEYADARHEFSKCLMIEPECSVCSDYLDKINKIQRESPEKALDYYEKTPVAILESQKLDECKTFVFDGTKSYTPEGKIVTYAWDFGDGTKAQGPSVVHTYAKTGKYNVTLTATNDSGLACNKAMVTEELTVAAAPNISIEGPVSSCPNTEVAFEAKVDAANKDKFMVSWDFGDGTTAEGLAVKHTYAQAGKYTVKAKVTDDSLQGCNSAVAGSAIKINMPPKAVAGNDIITCFPAEQPTLEVKFDGSASEGESLTYLWDFGDGVTSNLVRPVHVYRKSGKYKVTLTVTSDAQSACNKSEDSINVILNHPPIADAGENKVCCLGEPVLFDASRSSDPDGDVLTYAWDFGDGTSFEGKEATHTYAKAGEYKVVLKVSDGFMQSNCNSSIAEFTAKVAEVPVAIMTIKPYTAEENK
ncbi:MAG: PKD domain-containing protein [Candidatus Omnitrophica bacterium]|nr:PKD domain-containing protein [Candidatus Omnitrophota bacterium]